MADLVMRKRPAQRAGEMGLFIDAEAFEDEFQSIKQSKDVVVTAVQSRSVKQMRLAWGLAGKIAKSGALGDADQREVMNYLLKKAKHVRYIANQHRDGVEVEVIVKSIRFASMEDTAFNRLLNRMIYIVLSEILPDMAEGDLRDEISKMAGADAITPEPEKKQRKPRKPLEPVSIIPPHDADGVVIETPLADGPQPPASVPSATPALPTPAAHDEGGQAAIPKNATEWARYALAWLADMEHDDSKNHQDIMFRWNGERDLRNACGVTSEDRQPIFEVYNSTIERLRVRSR